MKDYWILQLALWVWVWFTYQKYFKSFDQKSGGLEKSNVAKGVNTLKNENSKKYKQKYFVFLEISRKKII